MFLICTVCITSCQHALKYLFYLIHLLQAPDKAFAIGVMDSERLKSATGAAPVIKINTDKDQKVRENFGAKIANQNSAVGNNSPWGRSHHDALIGTQNNVPITQREYKTDLGRLEVTDPISGGRLGGLGGAEAVSTGGSEPAVKASNLNLQSQLRNLLKCGGTAAAVNPFAPRKTLSDTPLQGHYFFSCWLLVLCCDLKPSYLI
jgi:hypothetical protein